MKDMKSIDDLRQHAINTLKKLESGKIDIEEAGVTSKLYENIISSLKTEMEYHKILGQKANIKFLEGAKIVEEITTPKLSTIREEPKNIEHLSKGKDKGKK